MARECLSSLLSINANSDYDIVVAYGKPRSRKAFLQQTEPRWVTCLALTYDLRSDPGTFNYVSKAGAYRIRTVVQVEVSRALIEKVAAICVFSA